MGSSQCGQVCFAPGASQNTQPVRAFVRNFVRLTA
jgi:hypothetical protein